jgi:hypothetical protein
MTLRRAVSLFTLAVFATWLTACGGGGGSTPPPAAISVALSPAAPTSLAASATASLSAVVTNDSANAGVKWSVSCGSSSCGTFSSASTPSGTATTYTAPSAATTVTVVATSVSDGTKTASATITITAISVALNPTPPTSLVAGTTTSLTAVVTNDSANAGVKWTVSCSGSSCGTFSAASTASGTATTYTAPATPPSPATVTVTATSVTDTTKTATATITITAGPAGITVAFSATPPTSLIINTTASLTAVVTNDSANAGVKWTVTCGNSSCGSFSSTSTASGTATTYTAPSAPPSPATVTVTATSVTDSTKTATATITITNLLADGTYVYHLAGDDATGPYFVVGAVTVQNGAITGGRQDFSDVTNFYTNDLVATGSSLTAAGSNLQIVINTGNTAIGVSGVETLRGVRVSGSRVLISEFDTFASATGSLDLQTSAAAPAGGYAFSVRGTDGTQQGYALAVGGVLNINGSSVVVGSSVLDYNDGGSVGKGLFFTSGSVSTPDTYGRITITLTPNTANLLGFILTGYIVGTNQIQLVESQMDTLGADLGGMALGQGTHTGTFTTASVSGSTYVFTGVGADASGSLHLGGALVLNSNNTVSGTIALNDFSTFGSVTIAGGNYIVDATGRVSITNVTPSLVQGTPFAFELYLDGNGNAMEIGLDSSELNQAQAYQQTVSSTASFAGTYALAGQGFGNFSDAVPAWGAVGPAVVASNALTGFTDYNLQGGTPTSNATLTGTETSSSATLAVTGLNAATSTASDSYLYLPIDGKRVIAIQDDGNQLGLLLLEGVGP